MLCVCCCMCVRLCVICVWQTQGPTRHGELTLGQLLDWSLRDTHTHTHVPTCGDKPAATR